MVAIYVIYNVFFFFSSRRRHTRFSRDWSSDVCSSHLTDRLTGLLNRGTWENLVDAEFERYRRYGHATALIMFDIDRSEERRVGKECRSRVSMKYLISRSTSKLNFSLSQDGVHL